MLRHVFLVIDLAKGAGDTEWIAPRLDVTLKSLQKFIVEFCDMNPLAQVGIM